MVFTYCSNLVSVNPTIFHLKKCDLDRECMSRDLKKLLKKLLWGGGALCDMKVSHKNGRKVVEISEFNLIFHSNNHYFLVKI